MSYQITVLGCIAIAMSLLAIATIEAPARAQTQATTQASSQSSPTTAATQPPAAAKPPTAVSPSQKAPAKKAAPAKPEKKVDLNNASLAELKTLPSVGEQEAKKIIANRPYISKTDLVTKAGLPEGVYLAVRHNIVVNDMRKPAPKK